MDPKSVWFPRIRVLAGQVAPSGLRLELRFYARNRFHNIIQSEVFPLGEVPKTGFGVDLSGVDGLRFPKLIIQWVGIAPRAFAGLCSCIARLLVSSRERGPLLTSCFALRVYESGCQCVSEWTISINHFLNVYATASSVPTSRPLMSQTCCIELESEWRAESTNRYWRSLTPRRLKG
jgi:hypothetical protein